MKSHLARSDYLNDDELAKLLNAARARKHPCAMRDHALLALLANTGMRPGEAVTMTVADMKLTDHEPRLRIRRLKKRFKLGALDDIEISRALARVLRRYLAAEKLPPDSRAFPITVRSAQYVFRFYAQQAGLGKSYRLYALRHTALTRAYQATGDIRLVQALAGHASISTTQIYAHVDPRQKREAAERSGSAV